LQSGEVLYLYLGGQATDTTSATFNGGGKGGRDTEFSYVSYATAGGGASDVRLISGEWNDGAGLKSRIMVAGG
jgi:hypothetical protein